MGGKRGLGYVVDGLGGYVELEGFGLRGDEGDVEGLVGVGVGEGEGVGERVGVGVVDMG